MNYLDFELEIAPGIGRDYPIAVLKSLAGEAQETMHFPFDELQLESRLKDLQIALLRSGGKRRKALSGEEAAVQTFGRDLFKALFTGEVLSRYRLSLREAASQSKELRLKLRFQVPELAALPWEFLYDPNQAEYLVLSSDTPIVRYLELPQVIQPLTIAPPLRILGMVAAPNDLPELDVAREKERVAQAVADLQASGMVELTWLEGQTWRDLQKALRRGPWHIFHFIGHGGFNAQTDEGLVALCNEAGQSHHFRATELARLRADHRSLRLALLNACEGARGSGRDIFSSTAAILVQRGLPAVLAMQYEITDRAAVEFSRSFYEALAEGWPVDASVAEARKAISFEVPNSVEWGTPVLYMRAPDGVLFHLQPASAVKREQLTVNSEQLAASSKPVPPEREEVAPLSADLVRLHRQLDQAFDLEELRSLCFELGMDYDNLGGEGKKAKSRELIAYLTRRGRIEELVALCARERPKLSWFVPGQKEVNSEQLAVNSGETSARSGEQPEQKEMNSEQLAVNSGETSARSGDRPEQRGLEQKEDQPKQKKDQPEPVKTTPRQAPTILKSSISTLQSPYWTWPYGEPDWVEIPAGEFWMGSDKGEDREKPVHRLYLDTFYIARTPVTNAQYALFVQATQHQTPGHWKEGKVPAGLATHPVTYVNRHDAMAYCQWLSQVTGKAVTRPSEAEWEKAARGDQDKREYPWGDDFAPEYANTKEAGIGTTTPVNKYPQGASPYGVLDMCGNAWEWTRSLWDRGGFLGIFRPDFKYPYQSNDGRENLQAGDAARITRGGSWYNSEADCRCSCRHRNGPGGRYDFYGFRVAVSPFTSGR